MRTQYEHHAQIRQNKLCPFFLRVGKNLRDTAANWHKNIELFLITSGEGHIRCGTNEYCLKPNDMVAVNSGSVHRIYSDCGISYFCVIIDDAFCKENGLDTEQTLFCEHFRDIETETLYRELVANLQKNSDTAIHIAKIRRSALSLLINLFEFHIGQNDPIAQASGRSETYVKKAILYINDHYSEQITLENVANAVGISKFHLEREFKKYTNQTIFTFLATVRCKNAESCIQQGMSVTEAAFESGFESLSYFSRTYKSLMGHPPSSEI